MAPRTVDTAEIASIGIVTPIGDCLAQTMTSLRAGISRYRISQVINRAGVPMQLAGVPESALATLRPEERTGSTARANRLLRLALPALKEALAEPAESAALKRPLSATPRPISLFLALPSGLFDGLPDQAATQTWVSRLIKAAPLPLNAERISSQGRTAALHALGLAFEALDQGADEVVVGAVDSHMDLSVLDDLDAEGRVLADGVLNGFCPGEAAVFVRLTVPDTTAKLPAGVVVHRPGFGSEPGHRGTTTPNTGGGLSTAIAAACAHKPGPVTSCFASLNGERDGAREWGIARIRNDDSFSEHSTLHHPAEYLGDTGAACGAVLLAAAADGLLRSPGTSLVWCSADGLERAAVLLSRLES